MSLNMARFVFVLNGSLSMIGAGAMFLHPEKFQMGDALSSGARMFSLKYSLLLASFGFFSIFMHTQPDTPTKRLVAASFMLYNVLSVVVMFMGIVEQTPDSTTRGYVMHTFISLYLCFYLFKTRNIASDVPKAEEAKAD